MTKIAIMVITLLCAACAIRDLNGERTAPPTPSDATMPIPFGEDSSNRDVSVSGQVSAGEGIQKRPVAGAQIQIIYQANIIAEVVSEPSGSFTWRGQLEPEKQYTIRVFYKNLGYEDRFIAKAPAVSGLILAIGKNGQ